MNILSTEVGCYERAGKDLVFAVFAVVVTVATPFPCLDTSLRIYRSRWAKWRQKMMIEGRPRRRGERTAFPEEQDLWVVPATYTTMFHDVSSVSAVSTTREVTAKCN